MPDSPQVEAQAAKHAHQEVEHRFAFHPASSEEKRAEHGSFRALCRDTAHRIVDLAPLSRERSLALTALEEAMFWGNAAIARTPARHPVAAHTARPGDPVSAAAPASDVSDLPVDDETLRDLAAG